jgi:hypothetical protein
MENRVLIAGRVSRVASGMEGGQPSCRFRIGSIPCVARRDLAVQIIEKRGYPEHTVSVEGELVDEGSKKVLDIQELFVVD